VITSNTILDTQGISLRNIDGMVAFDLLDSSLNVIGSPPSIAATSVDMDTSSTTTRKISGVQLTSNVMNDVDPLNDLLRPKIVLGDGSEWPLGVFVFTDQIDNIRLGIYPVDLSLSDQTGFLDINTRYTFSRPTGASIVGAITSILDTCQISQGINGRRLPTDTTQLASAQTWAQGTSYLKILTDLCALGGYYPPYFDNDGTFVVRAPVDPFNADVDLVYDLYGGKIIAETVQYDSGILSAPNAYVVIDTSPKSAPISAIAYVAGYLPWSVENRGGRVIPVQVTQQGLASVQQAQSIANASAASATIGFQSVTFQALADPRHDTFQLVLFNGSIMREVSWSLPLTWGKPMTHKLVQGGFTNAG